MWSCFYWNKVVVHKTFARKQFSLTCYAQRHRYHIVGARRWPRHWHRGGVKLQSSTFVAYTPQKCQHGTQTVISFIRPLCKTNWIQTGFRGHRRDGALSKIGFALTLLSKPRNDACARVPKIAPSSRSRSETRFCALQARLSKLKLEKLCLLSISVLDCNTRCPDQNCGHEYQIYCFTMNTHRTHYFR